MQITDVRIRKVEKEGKMRAVVSITLDEEFVVHDIKDYLLQCRAVRQRMGNTVTLHIQSIHRQESGFRRLF